MAQAIGIGGTFMKSANPEELAIWYQAALGLDDFGDSNTGSFGISFDPGKYPLGSYVQWSISSNDTIHYPGKFMFNFIVDDIAGVIDRIRKHGGEVLRTDFLLEGVGTFAWFRDPEGNQMELWQPSERP
ncbi:VOC family protein [Sphingorhabdus sp. EL138]|uniref:VOC family protein n=1 Tax=Sphingorhabdus sp. EL138 TaxID=2073156 RepID=UPI000D68EA4F|nr:VOC family protein [Sphingorhabdus sp. EL138]